MSSNTRTSYVAAGFGSIPDSVEHGLQARAKERDYSSVASDLLVAVAVAIVFSVIILMIVQSNYIQAFSWPNLFALFGILFVVSKVALALKNRKQIHTVYAGVLMVLMVLGTLLVVSHDADTAKYGVYVLTFAHVVDLAYLLYAKYSMKVDLCPTALWGGVIADIALIFCLLYSVM